MLHIPTRMHVFDDSQFQTVASMECISCTSILCSSCTTLILDGKMEGWQRCVMAGWGLIQRCVMLACFITAHLVLYIFEAHARYALVRPGAAH